MIVPRSNRHNLGQSNRHPALAVAIIPPGRHRHLPNGQGELTDIRVARGIPGPYFDLVCAFRQPRASGRRDIHNRIRIGIVFNPDPLVIERCPAAVRDPERPIHAAGDHGGGGVRYHRHGIFAEIGVSRGIPDRRRHHRCLAHRQQCRTGIRRGWRRIVVIENPHLGHQGKTGRFIRRQGLIPTPENLRSGNIFFPRHGSDQRQTVIFPGGDCRHVRQARGHAALSICIGSPRHHRPVCFQRQAMLFPGGNRHHVRQARRHVGLTINSLSPRDDGPVRLQGQIVVISCCNGHHVRQARRHVGLAIVIVSPSGHRSV